MSAGARVEAVSACLYCLCAALGGVNSVHGVAWLRAIASKSLPPAISVAVSSVSPFRGTIANPKRNEQGACGGFRQTVRLIGRLPSWPFA